MENLESAEVSGDMSQDSSVEESSEQVSEESSEESSGESSTNQVQSEVENLQEELQQAVEEGASKKEIQQMIKEFELKVNGKTIKHKLDLSDEDAVRRELQKAYAFNEVSQEYATVRKQLNSKIAEWKSNPEQALKDLGIDDLEFAEKRINKEVEELKKDPQQKALEEAQRKIQEFEAKERAKEEEEKFRKEEEADKEAYAVLQQEIQEALSNHPFIKPTESSQRRVADLMAHYSAKFPNITAEQVLPIVESEMKQELNELLESLPEEYIEKFLGKNAIDKLAKKFTKPAPPVKKAPPKAPMTTSQVKVPTSNGAKQGDLSNSKPKKSFEEIMAGR